jgi:hypothetical protein
LSEITLDLRLVVTDPEGGLRINGLIAGLKEGAPQIHEAILITLMKAIEEKVVERWVQRDPERYRRNGSQSKARQLKSSWGPIRYGLAQMVDRKTGKSSTPLVMALSIQAHDRYLEEAMEPSIGLVVHVSFRRATSEVKRSQNQSMSHTTVHRRLREFAQTQNPFGEMKGIPFRFLLVDGTKVRLQGVRGKDLGQAEMR